MAPSRHTQTTSPVVASGRLDNAAQFVVTKLDDLVNWARKVCWLTAVSINLVAIYHLYPLWKTCNAVAISLHLSSDWNDDLQLSIQESFFELQHSGNCDRASSISKQ